MTQKMVYTIGYSGRTPSELADLAAELDAVIFDIRFAARSRAPQWRKGALAMYLGDRYRHLRELGNQNYKGGPTCLLDYDAGKAAIAAAEHNVILMCGCKDPADCHRTEVAEMLQRDGFRVSELNMPIPPKPTQQAFWGVTG